MGAAGAPLHGIGSGSSSSSSGPKLRLRDALPLWWLVARQWFTGSARLQARLYVCLCLCLALANTLLSVRVSYAQKHFSTGLAEKNRGAWQAAVWEFVGIICVAAPIRALDFYVEKRLVALWRFSLTQALITAYTSNKAYFHLQLARGTEGEAAAAEAALPPAAVDAAAAAAAAGSAAAGGSGSSCSDGKDAAAGASAGLVAAGFSGASTDVDNPDQRITADVSNFVSTSVGLVLLLTKKLLNCAAFAGVLWSISPRLVLFLACYATLGTAGTAALFGRPLTRLQQATLRLEADLRFGLVRLRENAEAVAFYGGEGRESADLSRRLAALLRVLLARIAWLGGYELWVTTYSYATILLPSLVLAPQYFAGAIPFGTLTQASYAFTVLEGALGLLLAKIDQFSALAAEMARLAGLLAALEAADRDAGGDGVVQGFSTCGGCSGTPGNGGNGGSGCSSGSSSSSLLAGLLGLLGFSGSSGSSGSCGSSGRKKAGARGQQQQQRGKRRDKLMRRPARPGAAAAAGEYELVSAGAVAAVSDVRDSEGASDDSGGDDGPDADEEAAVKLLLLPGGSGSSGVSAGGALPGTAAANGAAGSSSRALGDAVGCGAAAANGSGGGSGGASKPQLSRVLRLMDGCSPGLVVEGLSACVPGQHHCRMVVCRDLSFTLAAGESLLVMGPSGCGKSSLLRIIAGLWTVGGGTIRGPAPEHTFFLPQKPFMPLGSLRQQLLFPSTWETPEPGAGSRLPHGAPTQPSAAGSSSSSSNSKSCCVTIGSSSSTEDLDAQLTTLLRSVNLGHLLTRFSSGLDASVDWASVLSLGEQQRVALLRLLYHRPALAFLDEATAALDPGSEGVVYGLLRQACPCYVSVGHRLQLLDWHSHVLVADVAAAGGEAGEAGGGGVWRKYSVAEYRQRLAAGLEGC